MVLSGKRVLFNDYRKVIEDNRCGINSETGHNPYSNTPIEPKVTNCDISDNNSLLKCVIADVTRK